MKAFNLLVSLLMPAIAAGLLESTMNEEGIVPDDATPQEIGFERELQHRSQGIPGLSDVRYPGGQPRTTRVYSGKGGSKGIKGSKGSKGMVVVRREPECEAYRVYYEKDEYRQNLNEIGTSKGSKGVAIGYTVDRLNLYDARTDRLVGFVTESNIITGRFDCTATGALSFDKTPSGKSGDQLFYQGTCSTQQENAVTGGTGNFQCAVGTARVFRRTPTRIFLELAVCGTCS